MKLLIFLVCLLPKGRMKNWILSRFPGWTVHSAAQVSPCLVIGVYRCRIEKNARIGVLSAFRDLREMVLEGDASIGQLNWISAAPSLGGQAPTSRLLRLAEGAAITNRHYIDCSGGVTIDKFAIVAGVRSVFITHSIDVVEGVQTAAGVRIGRSSLISSSVKVCPGVSVADECLVAMGSTISRSLERPGSLYAGAPAVWKKEIGGRFFERTVRYVNPR